jgi:hypothetical protein
MDERCYDQWNLDTLPEDVLKQITSYLEEATILHSLRVVCRRIYGVFSYLT